MSSKPEQKLDFASQLDFSQILTNPILDIAARFWEEDRYQAFRICYRSMRRIDDLIDDRKEKDRAITPEESQQIKGMISDWLDSVRRREPPDRYQKQFIETLERFRIPFWPWERFGKSMAYDLDHSGFSSFLVFLRYAEGAAISPASIFMHLCGVTFDNGLCRPPDYDIRKAARPLAIFSYLVHIIRDFQKDQQAGLNYFAADMTRERGLTNDDLRTIAEGKTVSEPIRDLIAAYVRFARYYQKKAKTVLKSILPQLEDRYQLSLMIIYNLYLQILERVDIKSGNFITEEVNPPAEEIQKRIEQTIAIFKPVRS